MRDIIAIGGSAGAIESIQRVLKALPPDFPASLFVVIHTSAEGPGLLPKVLSRVGGLPAMPPVDRQPIQQGQIYVAPPDFHMVIADGVIRLQKGPRENGSRPSIDTLFRSVATQYGARATAVLLSGYLDDGAAGMYAVRHRGGLGIIQEPNDALVQDMPSRALEYAGADFVLPASEIGRQLLDLVDGARKVIPMKKKSRSRAQTSQKLKLGGPNGNENTPNALTAYTDEGEGTPSPFACPECHGVLWEIKEGGSVRYKCRTGHAYSEASLNEELSRAGETALWAAMRALEEKASMARRMADAASGPKQWKGRLQEEARTFAQHAEVLRGMILGEPIATDEVVHEAEK